MMAILRAKDLKLGSGLVWIVFDAMYVCLGFSVMLFCKSVPWMFENHFKKLFQLFLKDLGWCVMLTILCDSKYAITVFYQSVAEDTKKSKLTGCLPETEMIPCALFRILFIKCYLLIEFDSMQESAFLYYDPRKYWTDSEINIHTDIYLEEHWGTQYALCWSHLNIFESHVLSKTISS